MNDTLTSFEMIACIGTCRARHCASLPGIPRGFSVSSKHRRLAERGGRPPRGGRVATAVRRNSATWFEPDLDQDLRFAPALVVLTDQRVLGVAAHGTAGPDGDGNGVAASLVCRAWPLGGELTLRAIEQGGGEPAIAGPRRRARPVALYARPRRRGASLRGAFQGRPAGRNRRGGRIAAQRLAVPRVRRTRGRRVRPVPGLRRRRGRRARRNRCCA